MKNLKELVLKKEIEILTKENNQLMESSDEVFKYNAEQWEAYHQRITDNQEKMISLIHDLFLIRCLIKEQNTYHQGEGK